MSIINASVFRVFTTLILIASGALISLVLPCVTPFGALAACAMLRGRMRSSLMVVGVAWFVNEVAGLGFFGYPHTGESYAWAVLQLLAAVSASVVCAVIADTFRNRPYALRAGVAAVAATLAFECSLYVAARAAGLSLASFTLDIDVLVIISNAAFFTVFESVALLGRTLVAQRGPEHR